MKLYSLIKEDLSENIRSFRAILIVLLYILCFVTANYLVVRASRILGALTLVDRDILALLMESGFFGIPFNLAISYYLSLIILPILASIFAYKSISGEIEGNTIINLLLRVRRGTIILSRIISSFLIINAINASLFIISSLYFTTPSIVLPLTMIAYLALYSLPLIAIVVFISSSTRQSHLSLIFSILFFLALFFVSLTQYGVLSPFHHVLGSFGFVDKTPLEFIFAGIPLFIFFGIFSLLAIISFRRYEP